MGLVIVNMYRHIFDLGYRSRSLDHLLNLRLIRSPNQHHKHLEDLKQTCSDKLIFISQSFVSKFSNNNC